MDKYKQFFETFKKTIYPLGWIFGLLSSAVIVISIINAVNTKDWIYAVMGIIGAAQLSLSAAMMMLGKAAKRIVEEPKNE